MTLRFDIFTEFGVCKNIALTEACSATITGLDDFRHYWLPSRQCRMFCFGHKQTARRTIWECFPIQSFVSFCLMWIKH